MTLSRRSLLHAMGALGGLAALRPSWALAGSGDDPRLVLLILRGGLDGLAAVVPHGDADHSKARGEVAIPDPGRQGGCLGLDGFFGLHPSLAPIHPWFEEGDLAMLHAAALPYRERSHFDAQNVLENGRSKPFATETGWLNRAVASLGGTASTPMAMSRTVPLVLRGSAPVTSADPLRSWMPDDGLLARIADLYAVDPELGPALESALATQGLLEAHRDGAMTDTSRGRGGQNDLPAASRAIGAVLAASDGPRVVVAEAGGWDTHTGQQATLSRQLTGLAGALTGFRDGLGDAWEHTAILVVTEFGRTVHANGSGGTDHGTGGVAFAAGGAVRGGRVLGKWPGLREGSLREGRDLRPTTDLRALFKAALRDHLGVPESALEDKVFPGTRDVATLDLF